MYTDHSILELVQLLKQGDKRAYLQFYDRYKVVLHDHAYKKLGNLDDADDIVQDLFIYIWENRAHIEFSSNISGYLFTAVRNRVLNHMVKKQRESSYLDSLTDFINQGDYNTDLALREKELQQIVEEEVNALPPRMREVYNLSRNEGLSHKQISSRLGTSEQTVSKQITNVLKILRVKLDSILTIMLVLLFN